MPAKLAETDQMTVDKFVAFVDARPDGERWELIEGQADRATGWAGQVFIGLNAVLSLPGLSAKLSANDIYRWTPIK